ncbi:rho GTPase-activating protein 33 isoform X2 [Lepisosteus oculatus]|uniref:rho GTPase-activating protein 33 isoform X2 n=1 Tax=Lepisosteus oculatus TaxID=7918 RepID=UPI0037234326
MCPSPCVLLERNSPRRRIRHCQGGREAKARSTDNLDSSGEPGSRSAGSNAAGKGKMSKRLSIVKGHFPKLVDCAHFHYENVDFGTIQLQFASEQNSANWASVTGKDLVFLVQVSCQGKTWLVRRTYEEFRTLDSHLHQCIYDRRYSQLVELPPIEEFSERLELFTPLLSEYLNRLSMIVDNKLNCGPVLTWMEIDNRGNRFLLKEEASLNIPAIAAAHVIKRYTAQASDEISIEVGDILSVIDMPPKEETSWWRGKHGFQVGFFPSECVELINERRAQPSCAPAAKLDVDGSNAKAGIVGVQRPPSPTSVSRKHGKLMGFLRTFMKSRPSKQKLKQRGILKERVFGCDLGEHLLNSGSEVPQVLRSCSEFIEKHGVVDGIYRHSGVSSNIQKLRHEFDSENVPDLTRDIYMQDIHCVGSLCKLYFRELPNPLLTYQLYDKFAECMASTPEDDRMVKVHDVIQQLPPPHYRTLEYLMRHLSRLATCSRETNMNIKNLAIVWAPNLLRSKEIEAVGLGSAEAFKEVRVQSVVVEFLLSHVELLFSDSFTSVGKFNTGRCSLSRPKSFVISSLSTRLLSLEEAQARTQASAHLQCLQQARLLALQGPREDFQGRFHTVLDLPADRRKTGMKVRKSAGGSWKTFFAIGKQASGRRKHTRIGSLFQPATSQAGTRMDTVTLRSAKSEESLCSQHSGAGLSRLQRLRRPRSSSDALSVAMEAELLPELKPSRSYDSLQAEEDPEGVYMLPDFSQEPALWLAEDEMDFSPTFLEEGGGGRGGGGGGGGGPELEPLSPPPPPPPAFRCGPHHLQQPLTEDPDSLLNQSEAAARKSLVLAAAAAPPLRSLSCCQHRAQAQAGELSSPPPERRSFTRKVAHALSPKGSRSPPLDISDPIAISVPAKVLEMIGGRAGELPTGPQGSGPTQPPQMISMLLRSCDIQLTESCQEEIRSKLTQGGELKVKGLPIPSSQIPPPPPPKNPARLMALALAESANKALQQASGQPAATTATAGSQRHPRPQGKAGESLEARFMRSLSVDSSEVLSSVSNPLYSTVRPLSVWRSEVEAEDKAEGEQKDRSQPQDTGTLSSQTSLSESGASISEVSASSSSGETDSGPTYKNQLSKTPSIMSSAACQPTDQPPDRSSLSPTEDQGGSESQSQVRKPPAYSRQFSAPHLQQKVPTSGPNPASNPRLHHSKSECSPMAQLRAFQPTRPKVPPKPPELGSHPPPARSENFSRRSLEPMRVRRMLASQSTPPLSRAGSERIHRAEPSRELPPPRHSRAASSPFQSRAEEHFAFQSRAEEHSKGENLYYEIAPEPHLLPSPARYGYPSVGLRFDGPPYRPTRLDLDPADRALRVHGMAVRPHHWTADPRTWALQAVGHSLVPFSQIPLDTPPQPSQSSIVRMVPVSRTEVHPSQGVAAYQRNPYRSQRSPSGDLTASQLHPYFENGKVCYRYFEANPDGFPQDSQHQPPTHKPSRQEQKEPIYVNFPFNPGKTWTTTDLDGETRQAPESPPMEEPRESVTKEEPAPGIKESPQPKRAVSQYDNMTASLDEDSGGSEAAVHFRSHSDPQEKTSEGPGENQPPSGKEPSAGLCEESPRRDVANESSCVGTSSDRPLPHDRQTYSPGPSRPPFEGQAAPRGAPFLRQDALRRSTSGGHYRQAFDVMPSGDQVLKFYRAAQDFMSHSPHPPACDSLPPPHHSYEDPYPGRQVEAHPHYPSQDPPIPAPFSSLAHMSMSTLGTARGHSPSGFRTMASQYNAYQFQSVPMLTQYGNVPRRDTVLDPSLRPGLRHQSGMARQGSLPGPNWTVHTEGQTRSYC